MDQIKWIAGEEYRLIPGRHRHYVSAQGNFVSYAWIGRRDKERLSPRIIKGGKCRDGYVFFSKPKMLAHHCVLIAWGVERPSSLHMVRHLNSIRDDNRLCNLAWGTARENSDDMVNQSRSLIGSKNHSAKMTEEFVIQLRKEKHDVPLRILWERYSNRFSKFAIWAAITGYSWAHLPDAHSKGRKCSKSGWRSGVKIRA